MMQITMLMKIQMMKHMLRKHYIEHLYWVLKLGFVFIISIFIPLFMATGLIRDEMTSGTMHYILTNQ